MRLVFSRSKHLSHPDALYDPSAPVQVFTVKLWIFFLAFYVHLGSLPDKSLADGVAVSYALRQVLTTCRLVDLMPL